MDEAHPKNIDPPEKILSNPSLPERPPLSSIVLWAGFAALLGAIFFSILATWQHGLIGGSIEPRGYIIPILFGGVAGALIGIHHLRRRHESRRRLAVIEELRQQEQELRFQADLLDQIQDKITATDLEGRIAYVNRAECRFFGKSREEFIGKNVAVYGEDTERGATQHEIKEKTMKKGTWRGEVVNFNEAGEEIILDCRTSLVRDEDGRPAGMVGISTDITERKKMEEALKESEEKYSSVVETSKDAIIIHRQGIIKFANAVVREMIGYSPEELRDRNIMDFVPPDFREVVGQRYLDRMEGAAVPELYEIEVLTRDGRRLPVEICATVMHYRGRPALLVFIRDISRRKTAEREREEVRKQLRHSQKLEAVGQLAGGIAHDFNNLLQVISGNLDMAFERLSRDHPLREQLTAVARAADRAARLVRQLLAFSRRQLMQPENIDLNEIIAGLMKMLSRLIGEHIRIDFVPGHGLGIIHADRGMMEQILMNLCLNARDAMPEGGDLTIETENILINGDYCRTHPWAVCGRYILLAVSDTGSGIDEETLARIYEPFFTTKDVDKGTGLGLATVYGIIRQHEGMIRVYSEPEKGTTFKVYLPVSQRKAEEVGDKIEGPVPTGDETVLLAEDDALVRDLARRILERGGYTVLTARDGAQALEILQNNLDRVDIALLDVVMPEMSGREVFERLRRIKPDFPVLFTTGYSRNFIQSNFMLEENLSLIKKPFIRSQLLREIRNVIDEKGPAEE